MEGFVKSLAPEPQRRLRLAIQGLEDGSGDIRALEGKLAGFNRLSVAGYRIIYKERASRGVRLIECLFAERRALVYELFTRILASQAME